ncbi:nickel-binding protein [Lutibacter sp.]|uniref:nickel-binding protein n=1 Tax=Lutibacter sp. TaxID=1925666 RepID=UPI0034A09690
MPIYMDRHDIPKEIKAEHVAQMHQEDLKVEHLYGCKGMTYWCDENRNTAFCLIEAPNKKAIQDMHDHVHGEYPHDIIEVDKNIVESFLGRIQDPEKAKDTKLNIINDPAFRVIMLIETSNYLNRLEGNQFSVFYQKFHNSVLKTLKKFNGRIVNNNNNSYLVSFKSVTDAVLGALKIQYKFKYVTPKFDSVSRKLKIALGSGIPVTNKNNIFEEAITFTTRMCEVTKEQLVISSEVKALYESENRNITIDKNLIRTLKPSEEEFLIHLMDYVERIWNIPNFNITSFSKDLGYSKSQLYRKLISLTGQSPNNFIKEFRLHKALKMLHKQHGNISETAYRSGFNSPAYFSKCFLEKYGVLPSKYIQQHIV